MRSVLNGRHRRLHDHSRVASGPGLAITLAIALAICIDVSAGGMATEQTDGQAKTALKVLDPNAVMRARGCAACHVIPGIPEARGTMGPTLKGLSKRKRIVARTLSNNDKNMRRWLKNPKGVKSDTMMPNVGLSDDEIETLVTHFHSL